MNKRKKEAVFCCVVSLFSSLILSGLSHFNGVEKYTILAFMQGFFAIFTPTILVITLIAIIKLNVKD